MKSADNEWERRREAAVRTGMVIFALGVLSFAGATAYWLGVVTPRRAAQYDVVFGSYDGLWADATSNLKGRGFRVVLWNFEHYKMWANKPDMTIVRIPGPEREKPGMIELAVPLVATSGRRTPSILPGVTPDQQVELNRRADLALKYWQERAREMGRE